jgi:hypothetical protein
MRRKILVLWNQAVHTDREFTVNRSDVIIKNTKRENTHDDKCGNTCRQKYCVKEEEKKLKKKSLCIEIQ